jgi:hypothetical protein
MRLFHLIRCPNAEPRTRCGMSPDRSHSSDRRSPLPPKIAHPPAQYFAIAVATINSGDTPEIPALNGFARLRPAAPETGGASSFSAISYCAMASARRPAGPGSGPAKRAIRRASTCPGSHIRCCASTTAVPAHTSSLSTAGSPHSREDNLLRQQLRGRNKWRSPGHCPVGPHTQTSILILQQCARSVSSS